MAQAAAAATLISIPLSIAANDRKAAANKRALSAQAALQEQQAQESIRQTKRSIDIFKRKGEVVLGDTASSFAKAGVDLSGSALLLLANSKRELGVEREEIERRGVAEANLLRAGAQGIRRQKEDISQANELSNIATVIGGIGSIAGAVGGK